MEDLLNYKVYNNLYSGNVLYFNRENNAHERYQMYLQKLLHEYIEEELVKSALDIACGAGVKTALIAGDFPSATVIGTDFAEQGVNRANEYYKDCENLSFRVSDAEDAEKDNYDLISAFEIVEHLEDWQGFLKQTSQIANRYMMISTPVGRMRNSDYKVGHLRNFKVGEIEEQLDILGFRPIKVFYAGFPFWSPISRNLISATYEKRDHESRIKINKNFHDMLFFLYKNCCSKRYGDQFVGLFERKNR